MDRLKTLIIVVCAMLISGYSYADSNTIEFSADAIVSVPQNSDRTTKLFVGKNAIRSESKIDGQIFVEIVYPEDGRAVLINSALKSYKERVVDNQNSKKQIETPCDQIANAVCEKLGVESIDGHKTEKWQLISNSRGKKLRTLHWIDVKRKLAIREFFPDGSFAELKMLKKEKMNGRNTEKWQRTLSRPDGSNSQSYQWYDTELKIAIREELPGGYIRELKNIEVVKQSDKLFSVPEDYVRIAPQPTSYQEYTGQ